MDISFFDRHLQCHLVYETGFETLDEVWVEGSPDVGVKKNLLCVRTSRERDRGIRFVCSVFVRRIFEGDLLVTFEGRSVAAWSHRNFNFFIHTMPRDGRDLYATRGERTGDYPEYHVMDNYLFTCLPSERRNPDGSAMFRYRMRRNPGFELMREEHGYRCEDGRWYRFEYLVHAGLVGVRVDGRDDQTYTWVDRQALRRGYLGFRTYISDLEFRDLRVYGVTGAQG